MHACKTLETPQGVNLSPSCDTNFWAIPFTPNIIQVHVFLWNNYSYGLRQLWRINDLSYIGLHWTNYEIGWLGDSKEYHNLYVCQRVIY
jgi:hypothetical protein